MLSSFSSSCLWGVFKLLLVSRDHRWFSGEVERPIARIVPWQKSDLRGSSMMFNGA